jgi:GNAT superfamily N-acetyltransferase
VQHISEETRLLAQEPEGAFPDPKPPSRAIRTPQYQLWLSPTPAQSSVAVIRTTEAELDRVLAEVRAHLRALGFTRNVWYVTPSSRPENLAELLLARGFFPAAAPPYEPELTAMALVEPPPPAPREIEARRVRDFEEYLVSMRIAVTLMDNPEERASWLAAARSLWEQEGGPAPYTHVAYIDGKMVGFGWAVTNPLGLMMGGSTVLPEARGRGAYRALVAARWQTAVELGTPALVIQAGAMSRPILERCGFQVVGHLRILEDPEVKPAPDHA